MSNPGYQITLDLTDRPCLVIGGGENAEERVGRLLEARARVTVVSPGLTPRLERLASEGRVAHRRRRFEEGDLEGVFLVMHTVLSDPGLSRRLFDLSRERGFLLNAHDQPDLSNFIMPALVRRGLLRVAVSTSGESPGVAGRVREGLEAVFDEAFGAYLDWVAGQRRRAKAEEPDPERRLRRIRETTEGLRVEGRVQYPEAWKERKQRNGEAEKR
jgi:siroheme synthase-like protein